MDRRLLSKHTYTSHYHKEKIRSIRFWGPRCDNYYFVLPKAILISFHVILPQIEHGVDVPAK